MRSRLLAVVADFFCPLVARLDREDLATLNTALNEWEAEMMRVAPDRGDHHDDRCAAEARWPMEFKRIRAVREKLRAMKEGT